MKEKMHIPPYMVSKNLSVCLSVINFDPNYFKTGKTEWAKKIYGKNQSLKKFYLSKKWTVGLGPRAKTATKFAGLAARAVFGSLFFFKKQLIYDFLAGNYYPDSPHSQGV